MFRFEVKGAQDAARLAGALKDAARTDLKRELDKGSREAGNVIAAAVADPNSLHRYIPQEFERTFDQAIKAKVEVRLTQSRRVTVVVWAEGKSQRRDIQAMNTGELRHPVFSRSRRLRRHAIHKATSMANPWVEQRIRPGLVDEPAAEAMPKAIKKLDDAVGRVVAKIEGA